MTVLNPFRRVDERIMDDADLAGPLIFCFCFATFLLFVRVLLPHGASHPAHKHVQSGKPQFGYIYGLALLGSLSLYFLLNMMSEQGIDAYRVLSVLGYCLLPMVGVGALSVIITLEYVNLNTLCCFLGLMHSSTAACWVTCSPHYPSSGAPTLHLASLLLFFACQISVFSSLTPLDFSTAALRCLACSTWAVPSSFMFPSCTHVPGLAEQ